MAKAVIGGDSRGAEQAAAKTVKGYKEVAKAAKEAGKASEGAAKRATRAAKDEEAAIQKQIQAIKRKQQTAAARAEAEKRMGIAPAGGGGPRRGGGVGAAMPAPTRNRAAMAGQALSLVGTTGQGKMGMLASMGGATMAAAAGLGIGAGLAAAVGGIINLYQQHKAELQAAMQARIQAEQAFADGIKEAKRRAAQATIAEWKSTGGGMVNATMKGRNPMGLIGAGIDRQGAIDMAQVLAGIEDPGKRARVRAAMESAARLGARPDQSMAERVMHLLSREERGVARGAGVQGGRYGRLDLAHAAYGDAEVTKRQLQWALSANHPLLNAQRAIGAGEANVERERLGLLSRNTDDVVKELRRQAHEINDPEGVFRQEYIEKLDKQIQVMEKINEGTTANSEALQEVADALRHGMRPVRK